MLCRLADFCLASVVYTWSSDPTQVQYAMANYSISYCLFREHGFFDDTPDSIVEDVHFCSKMLWKTRGQIRIVYIPVFTNMVSLQTGKGYLANLKQRFMQAERHMYASL